MGRRLAGTSSRLYSHFKLFFVKDGSSVWWVFAIMWCVFCCGDGVFLCFHFNDLRVTPRVWMDFSQPLHIPESNSLPDLCERTSLASQHSFNRDILFCSGSLGTVFTLSICLAGDVFFNRLLHWKAGFHVLSSQVAFISKNLSNAIWCMKLKHAFSSASFLCFHELL